ncbi:MAG TPA: isoamylase early set domain-containing protein [Sandaracinaceae bacterium LLY-WYZ-13_1]|nr:isoamylase early set domain-containing protein [Sandaracinaceae bacterium LLY-WYZ-13_1]
MSRPERVRRWSDRELDAAEEASLLAEAERDEALAAELDDARAVRRALADLEPDGPPEPPEDLVDRAVLRAVHRRAAEDAAPWWRRALRILGRPFVLRLRVTPTAVLVGAIALVVAGAYARHELTRSDTRASATAGEDAVAETPRSGSPRSESPAAGRSTADPPSGAPTGEDTLVEVAVRLMFPAEDARSVAVAGDFNGWATDETYLEDPEGDGVFVGTLRVPPGSYAYMFVVDGERWVTDPTAVNHRDDGFGNRNAVLRVD